MSSGSRYQRLDDESRHHGDEDETEEGALESGSRNPPSTVNNNGGGGIELSAFGRFVSPLLGSSSSGAGAYSSLSQQSEHGANPPTPTAGGELLQLKVHCKERVFELSINSTKTISQLKTELTHLTELPAHRQRLIYSGKLLRPEDQTLASFHIPNHGSIHLFPLPETIVSATAVPVDGSSNPMHANPTPAPSTIPRGSRAANFPTHTPAHFDPSIQQYGREVKMWCSALLLLSAFALFNNLSYFTSTGNFGEGNLDVLVFIMDTICSGYGVYVARLGIKSLDSLNLQEINIYVQNLGTLALGCILLRVIWVFDVVFAVERAIKKSQDGNTSIGGDTSTGDSTGDGGTGTGTDNPDGNKQQPIDPNAIVSFTIQAMLIAGICIYAWGSCYFRARSLQTAVQQYHEANGGQQPVATVASVLAPAHNVLPSAPLASVARQPGDASQRV